jgi:hypothetical protein
MRTIKPEAATSESLAEVPRATRWTFGLFWTHCDDEGRAVWNMRLIKAAIYPLDDDVTPDSLAAEFGDLERVGAVCRYVVDGKEYVHVPAFHEHQHPNRKVDSKLPPCPGGEGAAHVQQRRAEDSGTTHVQRSESAVSPQPHLTPVVEGLVVVDGASPARRATERALTKDTDPRFVEFWSVYPRRVAKAEALKALAKVLAAGVPIEDVVKGAARYRDDPRRDAEFTAHPATWLNRGQWEDDATVHRPPSSGRIQDTFAALSRPRSQP